ncbi:CRISPR-associated endonuclease Cas2 [Nocardia sp. NBC_01377]|uniref:CRISPR-associated endonuclease Cas2 n=1 Tax=Nocardia sp. NBC_01377 TaxID=2903595 RepID=UPI003249C37F
MARALVCYDISDNNRRTALSALLTEFGPRVQLSVFEVEFTTATQRRTLIDAIRGIIDTDTDQVRIYELPLLATSRTVIGNRVLEERRAFYVI